MTTEETYYKQFENSKNLVPPDPNQTFVHWCNLKSTGWTLLMKLVVLSNSNPELLTQYIKNGVSKEELNKTTSSNWTALIIACFNVNQFTSINTIELLINYGADPNIVTCGGFTALHACLFNNSNEAVDLLLSAGVNLECESVLGPPLIDCFCGNYTIDTKKRMLLLTKDEILYGKNFTIICL